MCLNALHGKFLVSGKCFRKMFILWQMINGYFLCNMKNLKKNTDCFLPELFISNLKFKWLNALHGKFLVSGKCFRKMFILWQMINGYFLCNMKNLKKKTLIAFFLTDQKDLQKGKFSKPDQLLQPRYLLTRTMKKPQEIMFLLKIKEHDVGLQCGKEFFHGLIEILS